MHPENLPMRPPEPKPEPELKKEPAPPKDAGEYLQSLYREVETNRARLAPEEYRTKKNALEDLLSSRERGENVLNKLLALHVDGKFDKKQYEEMKEKLSQGGIIKSPEKASSAAATGAKQEAAPPAPGSPEALFNEKFNIKPEELAAVEGFGKLSEGQKRLVLENLGQLTLRGIQEETVKKFKKETAERGRAGQIWRNVFKPYYVAKAAKVNVENVAQGGIAMHGDMVRTLVKGMRESGLDVAVKEKGEFEIQYAGKFENLTEEQKRQVAEFNTVASRFSKIPNEWSLPTASRKERTEYKHLKESYDKSKGTILKLKQEEFKDDQKAAFALWDIERKVRYNQLLNTHP